MTGWNMPPGCNVSDIPGVDEGPCEVCYLPVDRCICPECPECGEQGRLKCYGEGHLEPTKEIVIARQRETIRRLENQLFEERSLLSEFEDAHSNWDPTAFDITDDGL